MKWLSRVRTYPPVDLLRHAIYMARAALDCAWSTAAFRVKCVLLGVKSGGGARIWGPILVSRFPGSRISIGRGLRAVSRPYRYAFNIFPHSKIRTSSRTASVSIGNDVGFNAISIFARSQAITIGDRTLIGGNCQIMDSNGHPLWPPETRSYYPGGEHDAPVTIGHDVFIGLNVIITKGSTIGDNSVIGAGSVVSGVIPPNCLAAGVPARVLRSFEAVAARA